MIYFLRICCRPTLGVFDSILELDDPCVNRPIIYFSYKFETVTEAGYAEAVSNG